MTRRTTKSKAANAAQPLSLTGGAPVILPPDQTIWKVEGGVCEIFVDHPEGRTFLLAAEDGALIFGMPQTDDAALRISGPTGTTVQPTDLANITANDLVQAIDQCIIWLSKLFAHIPASDTELVRTSDRVSSEAGTIIQSAKGPAWMMIPAAGRVQIAGSELAIQGPASIPLNAGLGVKILDSSSAWIESTAQAGAPEILLDQLTRFLGHLPALLQNLSASQSATTMARLNAAKRATDKQVTASLELLSQSTSNAADVEQQKAGQSGLAGAALARAFQKLGAAFDPKRLAVPGDDLADIPVIARKAGVRARRVLLTPGWQHQDYGVLVSESHSTDGLITLIPRSRGTYEAFDPKTNQTRRVAKDEEVGPTAYSFYRPLKEEPQRLRDLLGFVWRDIRSDGLTALLAGGAVGLLATMVPLMTAVIVDSVIPSNEATLLIQLGIALGLVALLSFAFSITREVALHRIDGRTSAAMQSALWDRLLRLPASFFRSYSAGDLAARLSGIEAVRNAIVDTAMGASLTLVFSSFNVILLFIYAPAVASIAVALVLILAVITIAVGLAQIRYGRIIAKIDGELSGLVFQYLHGVTKLRVAGAEPRAFARWASRYADERAARLKSGSIRNHYQSFSAGYEILSLAILFAAMGTLAKDNLSAGTFVAFLAAFGAFQSAFLGFANAAISLFAVLPQYERSKPILEARPETDLSKIDPGPLKGNITVNGLVFSYGEETAPLFNGLDLTIEAGQNVALVGSSGSGKSTLLRLLLGFEDPKAGTILYDGQELNSLDLSLVRRQIGVVLQSGRVFAGSILENIRGSNDLSVEDCLQAAHSAGLEADLAQMPMGLHTPLTEGAATLSGGQRQRILIARALASKPKILFLDEATSALDNRTQKIVTETLSRLGTTRVTVAHRLSTVRDADKICVVEQGRILEQGSFDELMALNGQFAALASRQLL